MFRFGVHIQRYPGVGLRGVVLSSVLRPRAPRQGVGLSGCGIFIVCGRGWQGVLRRVGLCETGRYQCVEGFSGHFKRMGGRHGVFVCAEYSCSFCGCRLARVSSCVMTNGQTCGRAGMGWFPLERQMYDIPLTLSSSLIELPRVALEERSCQHNLLP